VIVTTYVEQGDVSCKRNW